jgi:protein SDA1
MVERGMGFDFIGDKGKSEAVPGSTFGLAGQEAMWAVVLIKELWRKSIWSVLLDRSHFSLTFP